MLLCTHIGFHPYSGGLLHCRRSCQDGTESHHLVCSIVQRAKIMPKRDAVRLIYDTQEGALLHHSLILITLQLKERR
jgi:hypothetical protein